MDNTKTDNEIRDRLKGIFPDPETAARVTDMVTSERPFGWSKKSNAPYYKRIYAEQIKKDIDEMLAKREAKLVYRYDKWCSPPSDMTPATLYNRINQATRYLIERMDTPDKKYARWNESVKTDREKGVGIVIRFIAGLEGSDVDSFHAEHIQSDSPTWKSKMDEWLESDNVRPFVQEGLILTPDEIRDLKISLQGLSSVIADITSSHVKLIKVS